MAMMTPTHRIVLSIRGRDDSKCLCSICSQEQPVVAVTAVTKDTKEIGSRRWTELRAFYFSGSKFLEIKWERKEKEQICKGQARRWGDLCRDSKQTGSMGCRRQCCGERSVLLGERQVQKCSEP
jgi:hypothetical protein